MLRSCDAAHEAVVCPLGMTTKRKVRPMSRLNGYALRFLSVGDNMMYLCLHRLEKTNYVPSMSVVQRERGKEGRSEKERQRELTGRIHINRT